MKHLLLIFPLSFLLIQTASAQFGIRGGINYSTISVEVEGLTITPDSKVGFHIGVDYGLRLKVLDNKAMLKTSILYSTKGFKTDQEDEFSSFSSTTDLNYIEVPIAFNYSLSDSLKGVYFEGGVFFGGLLKGEVTEVYTINNADSLEEVTDIKDETKSLDFGLVLGLGYRFSPNFSLGVSTHPGLSNILKGEVVLDDESAKNTDYRLYMVYSF